MGDPDKNGLKTAVDDYKKLERQKKPIVNCNISFKRVCCSLVECIAANVFGSNKLLESSYQKFSFLKKMRPLTFQITFSTIPNNILSALSSKSRLIGSGAGAFCLQQ